MQIGYYLEINLFCAAIILIIRSHLFQHSQVRPTSRIILKLILDVTLAICISDLFSGTLDGIQFAGSRALLKVLNLIYFETTTVSGLLWFCYVKNKLGRLSSKATHLAAIPALLFTVLVIIDPFTNFIFSIDSASVYHRGPLVFTHWIVNAFYLIIPTIEAAIAIIKEKSNYRRRSLRPLLIFAIAPLVASIIQVCFYGISTIQVGIVTSVIVLFFDIQNRQIFTDELTNLNNRHGLNKYINDMLSRNNNHRVCLLMMDLNAFKQINDRYGHGEGDFALKTVSDVLKAVCMNSEKRLFLCRYGGDEFVILGMDIEEEQLLEIRRQIYAEFAKKNAEEFRPYTLQISIGIACEVCRSYNDFEKLLVKADEAMYEEKENLKIKPER